MAHVVFVHPDLGIGGAERLVIDASLALKKKGHSVTFVTAHHDPTHCFPETVDGTLDVVCAGDWLPRSTFGFMYAFWAYIRMAYIALYLVLCSGLCYDVLFVDQVSACIPFLRLRKAAKIIFYCHFPDQLLTQRNSLAKAVYRYFIDKLEEKTTGMADVVLVNSKFTAAVFRETFRSLSVRPAVLYPSFDFAKFDGVETSKSFDSEGKLTFLSLNRFERKKNVGLSLEAFRLVLDGLGEDGLGGVQLVVAGGYDPRVTENIEYFSELEELAHSLAIHDHVIFLKSPSDSTKLSLLRQAACLLYTPENEHFGIVPVEAMCLGTPVIAVNSGGPTETVVDAATGFLQDPNPQSFASAMRLFVDGSISKSDMAATCRQHVKEKFSFNKFADQLHHLVQSLMDGRNL